MQPFDDLLKFLKLILGLNSNSPIPFWVFQLLGCIMLLFLLLLVFWFLLFLMSRIRKLWVESLLPLFYNEEERRRTRRRQRFADHVESEIRRLNSLEVWSDYRFAELEAEVEAEGRRRIWGSLPIASRSRSGLRREHSLSKALESSQERLVLLEGDPGSGKSVALRHVAQSMARRAIKSRNVRTVIPIYVNLKELEREIAALSGASLKREPATRTAPNALLQFLEDHFNLTELGDLCFGLGVDYEALPGSGKNDKIRELIGHFERRGSLETLVEKCHQLRPGCSWPDSPRGSGAWPPIETEPIGSHLIRSFVLRSLNRANDRDIEEFLDAEFDDGLREGTWLFLFDSFDELPEVLSSTETDRIIRSYADAISDFLHGMNQCRGIVASRQFRGPGQLGWPRFRILPLTEKRRRMLIGRADLKPELEMDLIGGMGTARDEVRAMASNPMFLGLVCEHMRDGHPFPENVHSVFEAYVEKRLTRDRERLRRRFGLEPEEVRKVAESAAFCIAADAGLGLSPTRQRLKEAMPRLGFELQENFEAYLDAMEYIKLARSETVTPQGEAKPFTFAHRRFQEYFATCVVLREPRRINPRQLLTDARWRETAVVLLQTQPFAALSPIVDEAQNLLSGFQVAGIIADPLEYVQLAEADRQSEGREAEDIPLPTPFSWPPGALHLLGLLQDGFGGRLRELPQNLRISAGSLLLTANETGPLHDRKWALEVAGIAPEPISLWILRKAFASRSQWLKEVAYRQVARLGEIPEYIAEGIRSALTRMAAESRLQRERYATYAHLARLDKSTDFLAVLRLLLMVPWIDAGIIAFALIALIVGQIAREPSLSPLQSAGLGVALLASLFLQRWYFLFGIGRESKGYYGLGYGPSNSVVIRSMVGLFLRMGIVMLLVYPVAKSKGPLALTLLLLALYSFAWAPIALQSAALGQVVKPLWYPLIPVLQILRSIKALVRSLICLAPFILAVCWLTNLVGFTTRVIAFLMDTSLFLGVGVMGYIFLFEARFRRQTIVQRMFVITLLTVAALCLASAWVVSGLHDILNEFFRPTVLSVLFGFLLAGGLSIYVVLWAAYLWTRDQICWYRWRHAGDLPVTGQGLLGLLEQFKLVMTCVRLARTVREQGMLIATEDTEVLLAKLALAIESTVLKTIRRTILAAVRALMKEAYANIMRMLTRLKTYMRGKGPTSEQMLTQRQETDPFAVWLAAVTRKDRWRLARLGMDFLDEVCKLMERVRSTRPGRVE